MSILQNIQFIFSQQGAQEVTAALGGMTSVISRLTNMVNPLNLALGAIGGSLTLAGIAQVGSQYEDLRIQMAQTLRMMGRGGTDFSQSLQNADNTIQQIYTAAAALPGEAEDYALAFRMAGANVERAVAGMSDTTFAAARAADHIEESASKSAASYQVTFNLVRDMTAIGVSMSRNSAETAMILSNALNTERGMLEAGSDYTRDLVNAMRSIPEYANMTVQSFNKLKLEERVLLMQKLSGQYQDMIAASSSTWAAVSGAFATLSRQIIRLSTADVFGAMTRSLGKVNSAFVDANGNLTEFGTLVTRIGGMIGSKIGTAIEWMAESFATLAESTSGWLNSLKDSPALAMLDRVFGAVTGAMDSLSQQTGEGRGLTGAAAGAAGGGLAAYGLAAAEISLFGPLAAVLVPLTMGFANFLTHTEAVNQTMTALLGIFNSFIPLIEPLIMYFAAMSNLLGTIVAGILPPLMEAFQILMEPILMLQSSVYTIATAVVNTLTPGFQALANGVGSVVRGLASVLAPIIRLVGHILLYLYDIIARYLAPVINGIIMAFGQMFDVIGEFLSWLGGIMGQAVEGLVGAMAQDERPETRAMREMLDNLTASMEGTTAATEAATSATQAQATAARPTPGGRGGGGVHQDFRNSRFEIQQKFEEGFDPDRVAAAFANDLGRVGEQRLSSGFEPLFGVR